MIRNPRAELLVIFLLVVAMGTAYWVTLRPGQDWGGDFAQYVNHARNIAQGRPYAETRYEITLPEAAIHMPATYPPVFPLLLAPVYSRFGLNYTPMKLVVQLMFLLAAVTVYVLGRIRGLGLAEAAVSAAAFALSGLVLALKDLILSDSTYLAFAGAALCAVLAVEKNRWDEKKPLLAAFAVAALMLLAYASRAIGMALPLSFVLYEALVKRRIRAFNVAVLVFFAAGALFLSFSLYDARAYRSQFPVNPAGYFHNVLYYLRSPAALWHGAPVWLRYPLFAASALLALAAWLRRIVTQPTMVEAYLVVVTVAVLAYSLGQSDRYLLPVLALYFLYSLEGLRWLGSGVGIHSWPSLAFCATLLLGVGYNLRSLERGPFQEGVEQPAFLELAAYLQKQVNPDQLVISWNPRVIALYTNRRSAWYPETSDQAVFDAYLSRTGAAYVLVHSTGEEDQRWLEPHVAKHPDRFTEIFHNADFMLYRCVF